MFKRGFDTVWKQSVWVLLFISAFTSLLYQHLGYWHSLPSYYEHQRIQKVVAQYGGLTGLLTQLKLRLAKHPDAKGYFMLGRLYAARGQWALAAKAFEQSTRLAPKQSAYQAALAQARQAAVVSSTTSAL